MKKISLIFSILTIMVMFSCVDNGYTSGEYNGTDINVVVKYGTPYYHNGYRYYRYNGLYYYPYYRNGRTYYYSHPKHWHSPRYGHGFVPRYKHNWRNRNYNNRHFRPNHRYGGRR